MGPRTQEAVTSQHVEQVFRPPEPTDPEELPCEYTEAACSLGFDWSMIESAMREDDLRDMTPMERFVTEMDIARDMRSFPKD